ncbi:MULTISPECIES: hypothetical protein [Mesobacillus]|uniref:Sigma-w pathway protein ysdB n=2 Tax=Mesobacillus TaxID=2675231 RepID=A0A0D6ZC29_9BACI|nr:MULTISPECIES: hypothetical protein [Mesobacillus]KIY22163.1 sigma-w pathway protein ysdB [Mesobacillus subterraneus]MDQ0412950.1 cbb3-type cytochrome oxidase subunit 3 [Mesobacillus stamsii]
MILLLRLIFLLLFLFLIYSGGKYVFHPKRKLELAHEQKRFFLLDDQTNARKNFLVTYKGVLFEGEKYVSITSSALEVVSIFIWPKETSSLKRLVLEDFQFIEQKIRDKYPDAKIDWKSPVKEFMANDK